MCALCGRVAIVTGSGVSGALYTDLERGRNAGALDSVDERWDSLRYAPGAVLTMTGGLTRAPGS